MLCVLMGIMGIRKVEHAGSVFIPVKTVLIRLFVSGVKKGINMRGFA
jgi:hypothetical protein